MYVRAWHVFCRVLSPSELEMHLRLSKFYTVFLVAASCPVRRSFCLQSDLFSGMLFWGGGSEVQDVEKQSWIILEPHPNPETKYHSRVWGLGFRALNPKP